MARKWGPVSSKEMVDYPASDLCREVRDLFGCRCVRDQLGIPWWPLWSISKKNQLQGKIPTMVVRPNSGEFLLYRNGSSWPWPVHQLSINGPSLNHQWTIINHSLAVSGKYSELSSPTEAHQQCKCCRGLDRCQDRFHVTMVHPRQSQLSRRVGRM